MVRLGKGRGGLLGPSVGRLYGMRGHCEDASLIDYREPVCNVRSFKGIRFF